MISPNTANQPALPRYSLSRSRERDTADGASRCRQSRCSVTQAKPYNEVLTTKLLYARLWANGFLFTNKNPRSNFIFSKPAKCFSFVLREVVLHISRVFRRIFTHLLYGSRPLNCSRGRPHL